MPGMITVFVKAILCNWMVCLAIVAAMTTNSTIGKIACAYMPVFIFFAQGFEHSVVNMFIIPTGMMMGAKITVAEWWLWNQIPVTLGNLVGGFIFTGLAIYMTHKPRKAVARADHAHAGAGGMTTEAGIDLKPAGATATGDFEPEQKRYLEGFVAGLQIAKTAKGLAGSLAGSAAGLAAAARARAGRSRCRRAQGAGPRAQGRRQAVGPGEVQARAASVRHLRAAEGARRQERISQAARQFPLALFRAVLCGAEPELLYVPAAHAERHPQGRAICRRRRSRRALWRRLRPCHHPRQSADPRDRGQERRRHDRGECRISACARAAPAPTISATSPARRPPASTAGADRHAPLYARMALPHSQRPLALRPAAQIQCRLRRRRHHSGAGGHQRHRLPGRAGERRLRARRLASGSGSAWAASPGTRVLRAIPAWW